MNIMPRTVSANQIQKNYRSIFNTVKSTQEPTIVLLNNQPDVAIVDINYLEKLQEKIVELEMADAMEAIRDYEEAKREGKLIEANSLEDLLNEN